MEAGVLTKPTPIPVSDEGRSTLFPLTPALSPKERGNRILSRGKSKRFQFTPARAAVLPLPKGEGRGEGEGTVLQEQV